jgi:hypothetical protein
MKNIYSGITILSLSLLLAASCKKSVSTPATPPSAATTHAKGFTNVVFSATNEFFSSSGTSMTPMDSNSAKTVAATIDITYTYDFGYSAPGFLDAVTRSSSAYYWSSTFYTPWTSVSKKLVWYFTTFNDFNGSIFAAAKNDQKVIGQYFSDTTKVKMAVNHPIWPNGACVGGRNAVNPFYQYALFGFKRVADGKRGLIRILSMPNTGLDTNTACDIIIEN